jgi:hypothetical protein
MSESARLKRELEDARTPKSPAAPATTAEYPEEFKRELEEKYDMPFKQILAMNDIVTAALNPVAETVFGSQAERVQAEVIKANPFYEPFKDDIDAAISKIPLKDRIRPAMLQEALNGVLITKLPEIIELEKQKAIAGISAAAKPATPPNSLTNKGAPPAKTGGAKLTKEQRDYISSRGGDPSAVETFLNTRAEKKGEGWDDYTAY